jgi:hypothetical protein
MRRSLLAFIGIALTAAGMVLPGAGPADAATTGSTTTTFTINSGALSITVPGSANLGTVQSGSTAVTALLGLVQVTDLRASTAGSWTTTVSSTSFVTGGGTANEIVPASAVIYDPGSAISTTGTGTFTPGTPGTLAAPRNAFSAASEVVSTSVTWDPQITIQLPSASVAGAYTGTITHSVA